MRGGCSRFIAYGFNQKSRCTSWTFHCPRVRCRDAEPLSTFRTRDFSLFSGCSLLTDAASLSKYVEAGSSSVLYVLRYGSIDH
jgi:hypothetical protein